MRIEIDNVSEKWLRIVKRIGIPAINYYSLEKDESKIHQKRLDLFNVCYFDQISYPDKKNAKSNAEIYTNKKFDDNFDIGTAKFKSNKFIFSSDKFFLSKAHWKIGQSITSLEDNSSNIIDEEDFWLDQNHFYFYK